MSDFDINWEALRVVLQGDRQIYNRLSADANHGTEGNAIRARYQAMIEQVNKTLRSMDIIEASVPSVPVQVQPARPCRKHGDPECFCDYEMPGLAEHTAAAQEKIIEAARSVAGTNPRQKDQQRGKRQPARTSAGTSPCSTGAIGASCPRS